jgi:hypothetical protein
MRSLVTVITQLMRAIIHYAYGTTERFLVGYLMMLWRKQKKTEEVGDKPAPGTLSSPLVSHEINQNLIELQPPRLRSRCLIFGMVNFLRVTGYLIPWLDILNSARHCVRDPSSWRFSIDGSIIRSSFILVYLLTGLPNRSTEGGAGICPSPPRFLEGKWNWIKKEIYWN